MTEDNSKQNLKVCIVNTSDVRGGAAIAARRLLHALRKNGVDAKMLVQNKRSDDTSVFSTTNSKWKKYLNYWRFLRERIPIVMKIAKKENRFAFTSGKFGEDISNHPLILESDVIHLHWINHSFLSLKSIEKLIKLGKTIVWTNHDMWAFTGACHHSYSCENYQKNCGNCYLLKNPEANDLSNRVWNQKNQTTGFKEIIFITCSEWLGNRARKSSLLKQSKVLAIPNPIDTSVFKPKGQIALREKFGVNSDKKLILFGAVNIKNKFKGFDYFVKALAKIKKEMGELPEVVVFGKSTPDLLEQIPLKTHNLGTIHGIEKMSEVYNLADVYVNPSLMENLPNTIMESFACGVPVLAFAVGGIPEMINHGENGYLAEYKSVEDLSLGIKTVLMNEKSVDYRQNCLKKVAENYSEESVSERMLAIYQESL